MSEARAQTIAALAATHPALVRLIGEQPDAALDFRVSPEDWTVREILAHLVDDEMFVMRTRFERMMKETRPLLPPHDEKTWYANRSTARDQRDALLADFALQRAASLGMFAVVREADWQREGHQPEHGTFTAEEWLSRWLAHDTTHLQQIETILRAYQEQTA